MTYSTKSYLFRVCKLMIFKLTPLDAEMERVKFNFVGSFIFYVSPSITNRTRCNGYTSCHPLTSFRLKISSFFKGVVFGILLNSFWSCCFLLGYKSIEVPSKAPSHSCTILGHFQRCWTEVYINAKLFWISGNSSDCHNGRNTEWCGLDRQKYTSVHIQSVMAQRQKVKRILESILCPKNKFKRRQSSPAKEQQRSIKSSTADYMNCIISLILIRPGKVWITTDRSFLAINFPLGEFFKNCAVSWNFKISSDLFPVSDRWKTRSIDEKDGHAAREFNLSQKLSPAAFIKLNDLTWLVPRWLKRQRNIWKDPAVWKLKPVTLKGNNGEKKKGLWL